MDQRQMHLRTIRLIGEDGFACLQRARVAVFGLGGVGGETAVSLCRSGIGFLRLVDDDIVVPSNINRQAIAYHKTIGESKTTAAERLLKEIDPKIVLEPIQERITPENVDKFLDNIDFVADCIDDVPAKLAIAVACTKRKIPIISAMGAGNKLDPSRFRVCDISKTQMDPLARIMRGKLRACGIQHLPVVFSDEPVIQVPVDEQGRHSPASISFVPPACGLVMAGYIVRSLLGKEQ